MKKTWANMLIASAAALTAGRVTAQMAINITGKVTGTDGYGISGVTVSLKGQHSSTLTGADGSYLLTANGSGIRALGAAPAFGLSLQNRLLDFNVPENGARVRIRVFSTMGRPLATLADGRFSKGHHRINPFGTAWKSHLAFLDVKIGNEEHALKLFDLGNGAPPASSIDVEVASPPIAMKSAASAAASTYDTLLASKTGYTPDYKRINSFTANYDFFLARPEAFWGDPAAAPVATKVMTYVFLNRTNGKYADNQIFWTLTGSGIATQNGDLAQNPTLDVPAHSAGRVTFHLGTPTGEYWDFIEQTLDATGWHGNTTRVDAFGLPLALRLICGDGHDEMLGEKYEVFYLGRDKFFAKYKAAVPAEFQHDADSSAKELRIVAPGKGDGGFAAGQKYADYFSAYFTQLNLTGDGATTEQAFACAGDVFGQNAQLCGAVNRHVAQLPKSEWGNPENFYQQAPANFYAKFIHENSFQEKAYGFAYDDAAGMAAYSECGQPKTLIVAIGF